jgi:alpha-glucosidase
MPWVQGKPNLGFSYGEPWLPVAPAHAALAAATQERDQTSTLAFTRALIALRKKHPALALGDIKVIAATDQVLAFERIGGSDHITGVFNLSKSEATVPFDKAGAALLTVGTATRVSGSLQLGPRSAIVV